MEVLVTPPLAERILDFLRRDILPDYPVTVSVETVEVLREDAFAPSAAESHELASLR